MSAGKKIQTGTVLLLPLGQYHRIPSYNMCRAKGIVLLHVLSTAAMSLPMPFQQPHISIGLNVETCILLSFFIVMTSCRLKLVVVNWGFEDVFQRYILLIISA